MKRSLNGVAFQFFSLYTAIKGYRFSVAATAKENADADKIFDEEGYKLSGHFHDEMNLFKTNAVRFIAYHHQEPVGTVSLADPSILNRPYKLHGLDENGEHFEIQSLVVRKEHRECSQLVLLGLFKEMYAYSIRNSINSWISLGLRHLYLTIRRYNKRIRIVEITEANYSVPLAAYLYENNIFDTCSIMDVADFAPWEIFKKFIKKRFKRIGK